MPISKAKAKKEKGKLLKIVLIVIIILAVICVILWQTGHLGKWKADYQCSDFGTKRSLAIAITLVIFRITELS